MAMPPSERRLVVLIASVAVIATVFVVLVGRALDRGFDDAVPKADLHRRQAEYDAKQAELQRAKLLEKSLPATH